jgi:alpha-1,3-fucosyltransferase
VTSLFCPFLSDRCDITTDYNRFSEADAVVFHMFDGVDRTQAKEKRHPKQRFVFVLWEPSTKEVNLQPYRGFFNWTMTYRLKSHILATYYPQNGYVHTSSDYYRLMLHENSTRKLNLKIKKVDHRPSNEILQKKKLGTAAALISNCGTSSNRLEFIKELQRYIDVKVYGQCGDLCPSDVNCREFIAENYYFFLSFESSLCLDYTSKSIKKRNLFKNCFYISS